MATLTLVSDILLIFSNSSFWVSSLLTSVDSMGYVSYSPAISNLETVLSFGIRLWDGRSFTSIETSRTFILEWSYDWMGALNEFLVCLACLSSGLGLEFPDKFRVPPSTCGFCAVCSAIFDSLRFIYLISGIEPSSSMSILLFLLFCFEFSVTLCLKLFEDAICLTLPFVLI